VNLQAFSTHKAAFAKLVSESGTKAAPLLNWNRGYALLIVSYRNVSSALSLPNKLNSIYSRSFYNYYKSLLVET
jgi:hypothetical protein